MRNAWNEDDRRKCATDLELRAYSSRLIGRDPALVLHGGGNTSVKSTRLDRFGVEQQVLWIKASGFDLAKMGTEGFTALDQSAILRLAELSELSDADMVNECLRARLDAAAAPPSIEAIVHALFPFKFVDHTHADAVLTISNSVGGRERLAEIYGSRVLVLPYVKPGFDLALQIRDTLQAVDLNAYEAIVLEHHGVFTYADDARASYDAMINVVDAAERWLLSQCGEPEVGAPGSIDPVRLACLRREVSGLAGRAVISLPVAAIPRGEVEAIGAMTRRGTLTPEHVIHNKPFPALLDADDQGLTEFAGAYRDYVERANDAELVMLPQHPHWAIFADGQVRSFGRTLKRAAVSRDVAEHTLGALLRARTLGGWQGLSERDQRDLEYWELEQAKLKRQGPEPKLSGKVAVVTGAASGIGAATARLLAAEGALVVGLDINPRVADPRPGEQFEGKVVDLTNEAAIAQALAETVQSYGGIDMLVLNAGIFRTGEMIEQLADDDWDASLSINLTAHRKVLKQAIPYLRHGIDPAVAIVGSRNVTAPGPGAAAYSVAKAGLTQLMRVSALELARDGIRVNALHPDAVFDTGIWTEEALQRSAARYGLEVEQYKTRNLLRKEITSAEVGRAVLAVLDGTLSATTGAQIPVDGGSDRVI